MFVQLTLFPMPRTLDPGEHGRCLDCGRYDIRGTYGPPGLDEIRLDDGNDHTVSLPDQWFCVKHSHERWKDYRKCMAAIGKRRERLNAFRIAERRGLKGAALYGVAEGWLRDGTVPEE